MGRRKERRLAALSNAGRRVKLDLFAEPAGDLGGSSVHEQVGGDNERAQSSGVPNSPSSSGQDTQNPLFLLGQYSDEDLDEQSSQKPSNSIAENKDSEPTDQEETPGEIKDIGASATEDLTDWKIEQQDGEKDVGSIPLAVVQIQESGAARESDDMSGSDVTATGNTCEGTALADQISVSVPINAQAISEMSLGWRVVMHEESGQYYYWNVETGETSWDVPAALAQTAQFTSHLTTTSVTENTEGTDVVAKESSSTVGLELHNSSPGPTSADSVATQMLPQSKEWHENDPQVDDWAKGYKNETPEEMIHVHQIEPGCGLTAVNTSSHDNGFVEGAVPGDDQYRCSDLSANLVKQCQCLLDRLNSLQGYRSCLKTHERMSKYVQEVEVRLSDIDSLQSHGTSLLPFWLHSEKRLKHLEELINSEIYQLAVSAQMEDHVEDSSSKKEKNMESLGHESEMDRNDVRKSEFSHASTSVENGALNEAVYQNAVDATHALSFQSPTRHLESGEVVSEMNGTNSLGPDLHVEEDIDMDVDMDVEDEAPATITTSTNSLIAKDSGLTEQLIKPNPHVEKSSLVSTVELTVFHPPQEDWIPPPPPDDEPVPPPPPDNEPVPPPPPDELPEPLYPPLTSYAETAPSLSYTEQYNLTYPDPNFQYYGHAPTSNFYGHVDGSQVALDHGMLYYEAVPNTYTETAPVLVAPIDPAAYYSVHEGSVPHVPVVAGTDSSQLHIESAPAELLPSMKVDVSAIGVPSAIVATEAPAIANATEIASAPSTDTAAAAVAASSTAAKVQPKVMRTKKRAAAAAPSLRSNKRVSTLVDQWKAAKEEMRKDEEKELESAHESLEKKRQREIEEWRAKHIASGEARENANFQPLGGDWRKRVKRRQAQATQEAREKTPEPTKNETHQEDLAEFSTGLPSGWKAYYDDASKQVYYANLISSETTWTKPTR